MQHSITSTVQYTHTLAILVRENSSPTLSECTQDSLIAVREQPCIVLIVGELLI